MSSIRRTGSVQKDGTQNFIEINKTLITTFIRYVCKVCGKLYLGDRKMSRHLKVSSSFFCSSFETININKYQNFKSKYLPAFSVARLCNT